MYDPPKHAKEGEPICQYIHPTKGGCPNIAAVPGGNCVLHGGVAQLQKAKRQSIYNRLNDTYKQRIEEKTAHREHFALNDEIGILRMLLEEMLVKTQGDPSMLVRMSGQISELVSKVERTVVSAQKAEKYIGNLLSRSQAIQMMQDAINVIAEEIQDQDVLDRIATRLTEVSNRKYEEIEDRST